MKTNVFANRYNLAEFFFGSNALTENLDNVVDAINQVYSSREDIPTQTALMKYWNGEQHYVSSDLLGECTAGYGELGEYGDWEFPLPPKFVYGFISPKE